MNYTCDCCGKSLTNHPTNGHVCASAYGPISYRYCDECLSGRIEPYKGIIAYLACAGTKITDFNKPYQISVMRNLLFYEKSITEFEKDLEEASKAMEAIYPTPEEIAEMDRQIEESEKEMGLGEESPDVITVPSIPKYLKSYMLMDPYSPQGTKVRFLGVNGREGDKAYANRFLTPGEIYTVKSTYAGGWSSDVTLEEFPDHEFNTVMFSTVKEESL